MATDKSQQDGAYWRLKMADNEGVHYEKDGAWLPVPQQRLSLGDRWYFFAYRMRMRIAAAFRGNRHD